MKTQFPLVLAAVVGLTFVAACNRDNDDDLDPQAGIALDSVATSQTLWTGVAVSREGRVFANFPRMDTLVVPYSVAEVSSTSATPFPNAEWNTWSPGQPPQDRFVCVQSVYVDDENFLWVLDPANPLMRGVVPGGPKLVKFDVNTRQVVQKITFDETVVFPTSYLNDVRVDTEKDFAYLTDSGRGAIIVVNLANGQSRRLLGNDPSTKSENLTVTAEGRVFRQADGSLPSINADGIALNPRRTYLYYHALTARGLYRIGTQYLQDDKLSEGELAQRVEFVGNTEPVDGMAFGRDSSLYLTYIQRNAVVRIAPNGRLEGVVQDERLKWPDSFAIGPDGAVYVTTSQLHIPRAQRREPFRIFKFAVPGQ
jgi:sugar lactone lactonase YvrE